MVPSGNVDEVCARVRQWDPRQIVQLVEDAMILADAYVVRSKVEQTLRTQLHGLLTENQALAAQLQVVLEDRDLYQARAEILREALQALVDDLDGSLRSLAVASPVWDQARTALEAPVPEDVPSDIP